MRRLGVAVFYCSRAVVVNASDELLWAMELQEHNERLTAAHPENLVEAVKFLREPLIHRVRRTMQVILSNNTSEADLLRALAVDVGSLASYVATEQLKTVVMISVDVNIPTAPSDGLLQNCARAFSLINATASRPVHNFQALNFQCTIMPQWWKTVPHNDSTNDSSKGILTSFSSIVDETFILTTCKLHRGSKAGPLLLWATSLDKIEPKNDFEVLPGSPLDEPSETEESDE